MIEVAARWTVALVATLFLVACQGGEPADARSGAGASSAGPAPSGAPGGQPSPEIMARLDSGTVAYRAGRHEEARRHYRAAVEMNPHLASGWFGVHMAEQALGDSVAADSAMARVRELAPSASPPPGHGDDGGGLEGYRHGDPVNPHRMPMPEGGASETPDRAGDGAA